MFSRKRQSRTWLLCLLYKYLALNSDVLFKSQIISEDIADIPSNIYDDLVFYFTRGDFMYFRKMYNHLCLSMCKYRDILSNTSKDITFICICVMFFAELDIYDTARDLLIREYKKISRDYIEADVTELIHLLLNDKIVKI